MALRLVRLFAAEKRPAISRQLLALVLRTVTTTTEGERNIARLLSEKLKPTYLEVRDVSGGCGSMYEIVIESDQFTGKRLVQQHRMVNEALGAVVKTLHGLTIRTGNPNKT